MEGNNIRIVLTGILVTSMLLWGCPDYLQTSGIHVALTYHIFHVNVFHLAANLLSIWLIFAKGRQYGWSNILIAYVIATTSWYCSSIPIAGISNMIFAMLGLRTPSLRDRWWRTSAVLTFLAVTAGLAFVPKISTGTHLMSFALGTIWASVQRFIKHIGSDYSRASHN